MSVVVENKGTKVKLVDGTMYTVQCEGVFVVCDTCSAEYSGIPSYGYCDETFACAMADGESFIKLPGYTD
jgi:hypothetical protein